MRPGNLKYIVTSLLLALFILRGLESMLPMVAGYLPADARQEMELNAEAETKNEKTNENGADKKELISLADNDHHLPIKYALLAVPKTSPISEFIREVILPVTTPPPEFID